MSGDRLTVTTEHAVGWVAASLVGVEEARYAEPDRVSKHDFDEACLRRIATDLEELKRRRADDSKRAWVDAGAPMLGEDAKR